MFARVGPRGSGRGSRRGRVEGRAEFLLDLLDPSSGERPEEARVRVARGSEAELKRWGQNILSALRSTKSSALSRRDRCRGHAPLAARRSRAAPSWCERWPPGWNGAHVRRVQRHHLPSGPARRGAHRCAAVTQREHAIGGGRRAAALEVTEHEVPSLAAGALGDLARDLGSDAAERDLLAGFLCLHDAALPGVSRAFGAPPPRRKGAPYRSGAEWPRTRVEVVVDLRKQDHVGRRAMPE